MLYMKGQSRLYFLRRLGFFTSVHKLLQIFYQTVVTSILFYAVVCWQGNTNMRDATHLDKLVRKAGFVVGAQLDTLASVEGKRTLNRLLSII